MKIAYKISGLVMFLLIALGINTAIGFTQLVKIGKELNQVVNRDLVLLETSLNMTKQSLEKSNRFERMINVAEEISSATITEARKQYLYDFVDNAKKDFDALAEQNFNNIRNGQKIAQEIYRSARNWESASDARQLNELFERIIIKFKDYDSLFDEIYQMIKTGQYELSFDDLKRIRKNERDYLSELKQIPDDIRNLTKNSLLRAESEEKVAHNLYLACFVFSTVLSLILYILIIRSISKPLKELIQSTQNVGRGNFEIRFNSFSRDEIGEVSQAFDIMSGKLKEFRHQLEEESLLLARSLQTSNAQKKDLEKVNAELDSFVHTVSHDLAAPLMGIIGYAAYLEKNYSDQLDAKGKRSLEGIRRSAERMGQLIKDLLELTKISRVQNPFEEMDIKDVLHSVIDRLEFHIHKNDVDLKIQQGTLVFWGDRIKITELFYNLINNAIKFSAKKENSSPVVEVGWSDRGEDILFFVKDNGIGVEKKDHNEIFGAFKRLHTDYEGTGVGLSIVKAVVDAHGGQIWVESELGKGATFYFSIPKKINR